MNSYSFLFKSVKIFLLMQSKLIVLIFVNLNDGLILYFLVPPKMYRLQLGKSLGRSIT